MCLYESDHQRILFADSLRSRSDRCAVHRRRRSGIPDPERADSLHLSRYGFSGRNRALTRDHNMFRSNPYGIFSMPTLETPRLTLRRITMRDAQDIFDYSRDEEVARHVLWSAQKDVSEARDYCRFMARRYRADEPSSWGIIEKASGRLVGTIGYMAYSEENGTVEVGYSLARPLWNKGYVTEALSRVIRYTFDAMVPLL